MIKKTGGYRPGAGRKSQWNRPTKMIRVPAEFEAELLAIAHKLDDGHTIVDALTTDQMEAAIAATVMSIPPRDRRAAIALFKKLRLRLQI
ncbi:MAG TPA: hypothetical protein V6C84_27335 [Coleofasciculaceae cyanobacterium]|jgi:hypothetical protein